MGGFCSELFYLNYFNWQLFLSKRHTSKCPMSKKNEIEILQAPQKIQREMRQRPALDQFYPN